MNLIADFHIHSKYARACSKDITFENLEKWARIKGLNVIGTGDFQHPKWILDIKEKLKEDENGILWSKTNFPFVLQTEISLMYTQDGKGRRVHFVILAPNLEVADQIIEALGKKGRMDYDGRPIFGFSAIELVEMMMGINKDIEIIPAHAWTPWFGILGSKSGFNSIEECFKEKSKFIHAIETGMSSDPEMNWRVSSLDKYSLVSFADIHSFWPWRLGREATIFDCELKFKEIINAIRNKKLETIETYPEYGKYHFDGHRNCGVSFDPKDANKINKICPKCKKLLTIGVQNRVDELADREEGYIPEDAKPFTKLIPLTELIAIVYDIKQLSSKNVWAIYNKMIDNFNSEFNILLNVPYNNLIKVVDERLANVIIKNKEGKLKIEPGYDGVYGKVLLNDNERIVKQKSLSEF